jgi:Gluconate 2-dehydrogenase subunit 3
MWLKDDEMRTLRAVVDRLIPAGDGPGALAAGAADYIDGLLGAFCVDPPRIWAGGPTSGRFGGAAGFDKFHDLSSLDELAWRTRIEGSLGQPEREFNGPVVGFQQLYREGLAELGADFCDCEPDERDLRLRRLGQFTSLVFEHACEGTYGPPEYGGNRECRAWESIGFAGDVQPRGWTDAEVAEP